MGFDKNTIIGITLMVGLFWLYIQLNTPTTEQLDRAKFVQDSIELAAKTVVAKPNNGATPNAQVPATVLDSTQRNSNFGPLAAAATGTEQLFVLENKLAKYTFSNKGGRLVKVEMKAYSKIVSDSGKTEVKTPVLLLENKENRFEYLLSITGVAKPVSTQDLYFSGAQSADAINFKVANASGGTFEQTYQLLPDDYQLTYKVATSGNLLSKTTVPLNWTNHLDRIELNTKYERNYSSVYYKPAEGKTNYCSCTGDDTEDLDNKPVQWISHAQQFFNTALVAKSTPFVSANMSTKMTLDTDASLKLMTSQLMVPLGSGSFEAKMYSGPNEFNRLRAFGVGLEDIIPYGSSILGTINRWLVRPIFLFLRSFIGNPGMVILLLTLLVKLLTYPLSWKMILSQAKTAALKPRMDKLKEKYKDDQTKIQAESMKMYGEYGVNPLGGCLPMLAQMPIWLALYRFFPAAIEFRQAKFLWINDLTNYENFFKLPFEIPFIGNTIGFFALLWTITTLIYSHFSTKDMDFSANPAMKYMQYITPFIFFPVFNTTAAGLSFYMAMSNLINIGQTIGSRKFLINNDKLLSKLEENKKNPKKKSAWRTKLDDLLAEQQRAAAAQQAEKAKNESKK